MTTEPLLTLSYTLTPADALAYETLPREMIGWRKWALLLWLAGMGGVVAFLPHEWVGPEGGWRFWVIGLALVGVAYAVATLAMTLARHARARRRVPAPVTMVVERWGDHLAIDTAGSRGFIAWETVAAVNATATHVFINAPPQVVIIPLSAFEDAQEMAAFARDIDRLSQDSAA
jgi:hypothetical protein